MIRISDKQRRDAKIVASRNCMTYTDSTTLRRTNSGIECERAALEMVDIQNKTIEKVVKSFEEELGKEPADLLKELFKDNGITIY